MYIHSEEDALIIEKAKNGEKFIELDMELKEEDIVIINTEANRYYEYDDCFRTNGKCVIRKSDEVEGVSAAEIKIIKELMSTYYEMPDVSETLNKFQNLTKEQLDKALSELLSSVKRHKKISGREEAFLFDVFSGNKTKKQLFESGICTYNELRNAYGKFISEMQWCYAFRKPHTEHRINDFSRGNIEFIWTPTAFVEKYKIESSVLPDILKKITQSNFLAQGEKKHFFKLWEKYCRGAIDSQNERSQLLGFCNKIVSKFEEELELLYLTVTQCLIDDNKTNIRDIHEFCKASGYCEDEILFCMRKLGVRPKYNTGHRIGRMIIKKRN